MVNTIINEAQKMDRGYIRITKGGPTEDEQRTKLLGAGVAPEHIYLDDTTKRSYSGPADLKDREAIVKDIRSGSRVIVTDGGRFGVSMQDILVTLGAITLKGAALHDLSTGEIFDGSDLGKAVQWAINSEANQKRGRMNRARAVLVGRKVKRGPQSKLVGAEKEKARAIFDDLSKSIRQVAEETGWSPSHLRRTFGERGVPRGRRPKTEQST